MQNKVPISDSDSFKDYIRHLCGLSFIFTYYIRIKPAYAYHAEIISTTSNICYCLLLTITYFKSFLNLV